MYQPGANVRDLSVIQSARFMAMLFVICLLVTFWISFYREEQKCLCGRTDKTGRNTHLAAALNYIPLSRRDDQCHHYITFEDNHSDAILRIPTNKSRNHNQ